MTLSELLNMMVAVAGCSPVAFLVTVLCFSLSSITSAQHIDPTFAEAHSCNETCQQLVNTGIAFERTQHVVENDPFYSTNLDVNNDTKPGQLLHVEDATNLTNYSIPSGLSLTRFTYTTADINGTVIPASAYVLWPYSPYLTAMQRKQGSTTINAIAWTHGTSGLEAPCAPSDYQNLQYSFIIPFTLALSGFAVIAPDYAGLGVSHDAQGKSIPHAWGLGPAQANDLAYAIEAARVLDFPDVKLSEDFVAMGHSEGGGAAWAFAQRQADPKLAVSGYRGTVAFAPATDMLAQINEALSNPSDPFLGTQLFTQPYYIASVTAAFPAYNFSGLSKTALDLYQVVQKAGACINAYAYLFSTLNPLTLANQNWTANPSVQQWGALSKNGGKPFAGPLLVLSGEEDHSIPVRYVEKAVDDTCSTSLGEESVDFRAYEGLDHFPVMLGSQSDWMGWVRDRFEGVEVEKGCKKQRVVGLRQEDTNPTGTANWFVTAAHLPQDFWKLAG